MIAHVRALRINQWTKNAVVFAAFVFALGVGEGGVGPGSFWTALLAALVFCIASSGIYIINDIKDIESDRQHPLKKFRPIAAGEIKVPTAFAMSVTLVATGLVCAKILSTSYFYVVGAYIVMQIFYTGGLKQVALIDVFVIAAGFVLRALGGAVVLEVPISPWLLLCTLLLALFLGLCKRRHEKVVMKDSSQTSRPMLKAYDEKLLDQLIAIVSSATIVCYALYTLWPDTVEKFGTMKLGFTIPFVIFGLFRYLDLVYRHEKGGKPEHILLTDLPTLLNVGVYGITVLLILLVF